MKHLIPLSEHNKQVLDSFADPFLGESQPNGISCEKCGHEIEHEILKVDPETRFCKACKAS